MRKEAVSSGIIRLGLALSCSRTDLFENLSVNSLRIA
jgi:hypothetical protein